MAELTRDDVAHLAGLARIDLSDAELDHLAIELVSGNQRGLDDAGCPGIPRLDMQIRAANARREHPDLHLTQTRNRLRTIHQLKTGLRTGLVERLHLGYGQA